MERRRSAPRDTGLVSAALWRGVAEAPDRARTDDPMLRTLTSRKAMRP